MFRFGADLGPFLYCDYWASVLDLQRVVSPFVFAGGERQLSHFRLAVDRPRTRLPQLRYYVLAFVFLPVLLPYRVVYDLMSLFRGRAPRVSHPVDEIMKRYELHLERGKADHVRVIAGTGADAGGGGELGARKREILAEGLLDPAAVRCEVSLFFPTYKLFLAGLLSLIISAFVLPHLAKVEFLTPLAEHLNLVMYALLGAILLGVLRDPITAFIAPLPILAFHYLWRRPDSPAELFFVSGELLLVSVGFILLFFAVEWFLIPRSLPPTLFLYVNDPSSRAFPYRPEHAPYWLRGSHYWVWRFVSLVPGELHKFWERDWERVECWVRASGPEAGRVEWVVGDFHYRELWYEVERLVPPALLEAQDRQLAARARAGSRGEPLVWMLEVDMDPLFHAPYVRGLFLVPEQGMGFWPRLRRLGAALAAGAERDRFQQFAARLDELEIGGAELFGDVAEHFRSLALHRVIALPWSYWRYPLGAGARTRRLIYGEVEPGEEVKPVSAADPAYQIKQPRIKQPGIKQSRIKQPRIKPPGIERARKS